MSALAHKKGEAMGESSDPEYIGFCHLLLDRSCVGGEEKALYDRIRRLIAERDEFRTDALRWRNHIRAAAELFPEPAGGATQGAPASISRRADMLDAIADRFA